MPERIRNLEQLLDRIDQVAERRGRVSFGAILAGTGSRSFGPLLLLVGAVLVTPLSGIPGVPTSMGVMVLLIVGQLLMRRKHLWLPRWLLRRSVPRHRLQHALRWLRRPARAVDRGLRPRLSLLSRAPGRYAIAVTCAVIGASLPLMELVPLSATGAGVVLGAFGLALTAHDGLLALAAFALTALVAAAALIAAL